MFLIPVVCALLYGRVAHRQLLACGLTMCVVSAALVVSLMAANEWRFGRFEITSSSGRHLWQGVHEMADVALANSPEYQALKALDPGQKDWNFWNVPMPAGESSGLARDAILGRLARQAIPPSDPGLYLKTGMTKFVGEDRATTLSAGIFIGRLQSFELGQELLPSPIEKLVGYQPRPSRLNLGRLCGRLRSERLALCRHGVSGVSHVCRYRVPARLREHRATKVSRQTRSDCQTAYWSRGCFPGAS